MMRTALSNALDQLQLILTELNRLPTQLGNEVYLDANVGRHLRHVLDHAEALKQALDTGLVDYDQRDRGNAVETDRLMAMQQLSLLRLWVQTEDLDNRRIAVASEIDCDNTQRMQFDSNLHREILYVINHTIHHAAHIKLALKQFGIALPDAIGIAPGTATHLRRSGADAASPCAH
ncbi:MAG: hypothetical protein KDI28_06885 [Pseudomonadales bacterium]|nr:hypothetical protein [Pseudomonadales bacterium]MCP5356920.1 hypothetical protein [Pseudomonadales bacterium]